MQEHESLLAMAQSPRATDRTLIRNIADNLGTEFARLSAGKRWRDAQERIDLLGVAQTAFAIDAVEPMESKEAHALRAAAVRFERLLRRRSDKAAKDNPDMIRAAHARVEAELEVLRRYTHALGPEARIALAIRDAFDCANRGLAEADRIPTTLSEEGPLVLLTRAALCYTPVKDRPAPALRNVLEKFPVLRRRI
ncbi:hypothetical protein [Methylocystis echinoides]|uniref:Uncharacterized protein n=1 Tax=Methylocystis echinoides TaxID=29468 RepID=A0A9W6GV66_9HYPH|nr:hypothetical protein [Methylocystis echinoides]GLI93632.1 hypothetical protein LMG27198_26240 [Methylocystis echinoides]